MSLESHIIILDKAKQAIEQTMEFLKSQAEFEHNRAGMSPEACAACDTLVDTGKDYINDFKSDIEGTAAAIRGYLPELSN